jgi:hypothetical protein
MTSPLHALLSHVVGLKTSKLLAIYFKTPDEALTEPLSLVIVDNDGKLVELDAPNAGGVRIGHDPLSGLWFDKQYGYGLLAPLILSFEGRLGGGEVIESASAEVVGEANLIRFRLDQGGTLLFRLEDDEMWVSLET